MSETFFIFAKVPIRGGEKGGTIGGFWGRVVRCGFKKYFTKITFLKIVNNYIYMGYMSI
jgi:hypothetical protein